MNGTEGSRWFELNQRRLAVEICDLRRLLERCAAAAAPDETTVPGAGEASESQKDSNADTAARSLLDTLGERFGLSPFERKVLLLCAAVELDSTFPSLCAAVQRDPRKTYPTFSMALAVLPFAHWSALSPAAPLRYWRLIELSGSEALTTNPLRIDERILHYLTGVQYSDERLSGFITPLLHIGDVVSSHEELVRQALSVWERGAKEPTLPVLQFYGSDSASQRTVAAGLCSNLFMNCRVLSASVIPQDPREAEGLTRLWEREAALINSVLLVDCTALDAGDPARMAAVDRLIDSISSATIVIGRERRVIADRKSAAWEVRKPTPEEQRTLWQRKLGSEKLNGQVESLISHFSLNATRLNSICDEVLHTTEGNLSGSDLGMVLWDACRVQARARLDDLAWHIRTAALWEDLVLPEAQKRLLSEIAAHARQRLKVYDTWGFGRSTSRGLGISALFSGPSGTGKTMAAEVLANALRLDLYRIDLSQVVNKYIGETEKNLRRVFDAAEDSGAILLFDEADALFGKRSEVKDSHDRYANIEISYLLQRMEGYRGLAILTTNMKSSIDNAFLRRIRFVVQFPFPNAEQRAEIWRRIFPPEVPTRGLELDKLSRLNVTGGNIRNIALHAAFLAADADEPVCMKHLLRAARVECSKIEQSVTDAEIRGWV